MTGSSTCDGTWGYTSANLSLQSTQLSFSTLSTTKVLTRTDLVKLDIADEAYKRYYSRRHDIHQSSQSTPTRVGELLRVNEIDIPKVLRQPGEDDEANDTPLTTPMMEPEEVPEEFNRDPAPTRRARTWDHLPEPRTTRSKRKVFITAVEVRRSGEGELTFAIKVAAAKTSGPAVHEALRSPMREGLLIIVTFRNDSSRVAIYATVSTKVVMKQYL